MSLYCSQSLGESLARLGDELRFVLITSAATLQAEEDAPDDAVSTALPGLRIRVLPSQARKCVRCWHHRRDVGDDAGHPELCGRCVENVEGDSEARTHA